MPDELKRITRSPIENLLAYKNIDFESFQRSHYIISFKSDLCFKSGHLKTLVFTVFHLLTHNQQEKESKDL